MKKRTSVKAAIFSLILLGSVMCTFFSFPSVKSASAPHEFKGYAYDKGLHPIEDGTVIRAMVVDSGGGGSENYTTTVNNSLPGINYDFQVQDPEEDNAGRPIYFYIGTENTTQSVTFVAGGLNIGFAVYYNLTIFDVPQITDNSPTTGTTGDSFTFNVTVVDYVDSANELTVKVSWSHGSLSYNKTLSPAGGNYFNGMNTTNLNSIANMIYTIWVNDTSGNMNHSGPHSVTITDNDNPTSSVNTISGYWKKLTNNPLSITGTASDNIGLKNVTLWYRYRATNVSSWDGWVSSGLIDSDPWVSVSWSFTFSNSTGHYQFYSIAKDNATNTEPTPGTADERCGYDFTPPTTTISTITPYWRTTNTAITATISNNNMSGIDTITLYCRNSIDNTTWSNPWTFGTPDTDPWISAQWTFTFPNGTGYYRFYSQGTDNATNTETLPNVNNPDAICGYDAVYPSSFVNTISPYWKTATPITITATANNGASGVKNVTFYYRYSTDNSTWGNWMNNGTDNALPWSRIITFANGTGYYQFYSIARDNATNAEVYSGVDATCGYDNARPTCTIRYNRSATYFKAGTALKIWVNFTEATSGMSPSSVMMNISTQGLVNDTHNTSLTQTDNLHWYKNWVVPSGSNDGAFTVKIYASDNATNLLNPYPTTNNSKKIDNTAPTSSVNAITSYWKTSAPLTITATANDGGSGLKNVTLYYYYSANNGTFTGPTAFGVNSSPWIGVSWSFTFPGGNGYYRFFSRAADNVSNVETAPVTNDTICGYDAVAPSSSVDTITPYWKTTTPITITATASNGVSGLKNVTFYYRYSAGNSSFGGWMNNGTDTAFPWSRVITFVNGTGYYQFYSIARDNASNVESAPGGADAYCGYDNVAPFSSVSAIAPYWKTSTPITITATASNGASGVKNVTFYYRFSAGNSSFGGWMNNGTDSASPWSRVITFVNGTGYYQFYSIARDNATNAEVYSGVDAMCGYDFTRPACTIQYNRSATYFKAGTALKIWVNFTEATSGMSPSSVMMNISTQGLVNDTHNTSLTQTDNLHWYKNWVVPSGSNDGAFTVKIYASDNATNLLNPYPTTNNIKKIDNTAPICSIGYNRSATYFKANTALKIYANFTESGSGMNNASVTIRINTTAGDGNLSNTTMTKTNNTRYYYGWTIPTGSINSGTFTVRVYAQDNVTNSLSPYPTTSNTRKIDATAPTCTIAYNKSRTFFKGGEALKIYANFTESGSGMNNASVTIRINTTAGDGNLSNTTMTKTNNTRYYCGWTIPSGSINSGTFTVRVYAQDNVTNSLSPYPTTSNTRKIDNTAPTCTIAYNRSNAYFKAGTALKIYANFTEAESGMNDATVMIRINTIAGSGNLTNTTMTKSDATHYYHSWTIPSGSGNEGTFTVRIYAQDNATLYLNPYPTTNGTKIIDNTPPTLSYAVLDADNDGTNCTYVDVYFSETTMDTTTEAYTDFNINESGVSVAAIQNKSGNRVTLRFNTTFQTGDSPYVGIIGSVADLAGNTLSSGFVTINTYRINLVSGWNLISVPADPHTHTLTTVLSDITANMAIIWTYNASSNSWTSWTGSGDPFRLYPGKGYWIYMRTADTLTGNYNLMPTGPTSPPYVTLYGQKWNLIGQWQAFNQSATTSYGGGLASLSTEDVGSLFKFTGTGYANILNGGQNMMPGMGFWMWKETSGDKQYAPS